MAQLEIEGEPMAGSLSTESFETIFDILWPQRKKSLCREGKRLLRYFAKTRPADIAFLKSDDVIDLGSSGFAGIPEWDTFTHHISTCAHCRKS